MAGSNWAAAGRPFSRRAVFAGLAAFTLRAQTAASGRGQSFPAEIRRYADGATEFPIFRVTSPTFSSLLTAYYNRSMLGRSTLLFSSNRTGRFEVFRADIRSGPMRQLTSAEKLDPSSVALLAGDRAFCYFDGPVLKQTTLAMLRDREIYRVPGEVERGRGFSVTGDGARGFWVEHQGGKWRLRTILLARGEATTVVEEDQEIADPIARPVHGSVLYRCGKDWFLAAYEGEGKQKLALAAGETLAPRWTAGGKTIEYLNVSPDRGQLNTLREFSPEGGDKLIAKTSQFVAFGANADATVFVGASSNKASPHVLILLRLTRRELTVAEHRAKDPAMVAPFFAPNSQRIVFGSDLQGKPAIYTVNVERFVEETEG